MNQRTFQKKRKENLVQEGGDFLASLPAPIHGSLMGPFLKGVTGG